MCIKRDIACGSASLSVLVVKGPLPKVISVNLIEGKETVSAKITLFECSLLGRK